MIFLFLKDQPGNQYILSIEKTSFASTLASLLENVDFPAPELPITHIFSALHKLMIVLSYNYFISLSHIIFQYSVDNR